MKMKKCCFVLLYFGKMPVYFPLFLKSCEKNPRFDWIIFTDDKTDYDYPANVRCIYRTFGEIKQVFQNNFDFMISLSQPYKLCDYRPSFGLVFRDYLSGYRYWGYCDNDLIFGDLEHFLPDEFMERYDKLFCLGHITIFRNTQDNNKLFMKEINGRSLYKTVFTAQDNLIFDESWNNRNNIHDIFVLSGKTVYENDLSVNLKILSRKFIKITFRPEQRVFEEDDRESLYIWDNGKILRFFMQDGILHREEYLYIHLQERKMKLRGNVIDQQQYKIVPNSFLPLETHKIDQASFPLIKKRAFNMHLLQYHMKWKLRKIKKIMKLK